MRISRIRIRSGRKITGKNVTYNYIYIIYKYKLICNYINNSNIYKVRHKSQNPNNIQHYFSIVISSIPNALKLILKALQFINPNLIAFCFCCHPAASKSRFDISSNVISSALLIFIQSVFCYAHNPHHVQDIEVVCQFL